jgi:hypothetical protein
MAKIQYIEKKFSTTSQEIIDTANQIIETYRQQGFDLTLRQLFYQFVSRDIIENTERSYKRLGSIINDARLAGLIDWEAITDRTRSLRKNQHWENPGEIIKAAAQSFRHDLWRQQPYRVEVWIEKDALVGVIENVCTRMDVPFFSCRGYTSQSEMWVAAQRLCEWVDMGQQPVILHFGDHDPSGHDMSRDITDRLELFGVKPEFKRIALNYDQIEQYNPPPNPAKITDSRAKSYIKTYGRNSWELDALEPQVIVDLIEEEISQYIEEETWKLAVDDLKKHRAILAKVAKNWQSL